MKGQPPNQSMTWNVAFPLWDLVADHVPVAGTDSVADTPAEDRVETILEIASTFRATPDFALGELYPLVPARFRLSVDDARPSIAFAAVAPRPSSDVTLPLSRAGGRRLHRTLAQVNTAAAMADSAEWPHDEVLQAASAAVFSLAPEQFYALVDVRLRGRDHGAAAAYVKREFHDDLDTVVAAAIADARSALDSTEIRHWFDALTASRGSDILKTHPQLERPLGLLELTLAEVSDLVVPETTEARRAAPPQQVSEPQAPGAQAAAPEPAEATRRRIPGLTADDNLETWEQAIRTRLHGATLAVEANFSAVELDVLLDVYGARFRLSRGRDTTVPQIVHHFPATTLAALVGMASIGLENNAYWDAFWGRLGYDRKYTDENAFRAAVPMLLKQFELDPIQDLPSDRYVQRLAVHAGIPAASFDRLVEVLSTYIGTVTSRDSRRFREWILEPSHEQLLDQLDAPTRNFVHFGGERGAEFLDKLARLVADVAENPAADPATLDADSSALPELVIASLRDSLLRADVGEQVRSQRRRSRQVPTLHLDPDDSIVVRIPAPSSHTSAPWTITLDTTVLRVAPERFIRDRAVEVPIDRPTRRVVISHPSYASPLDMRLYESDHPIVIFSTTGEHISEAARLPRAEVVGVVPEDLTVLGEHPHAPRQIGQFGAPQGWRGWAIHQWDLAETTSVRARTGEGKTLDLRVGSQPLPTLLDLPDDPLPVLPGVFSEKLPVLQARPWIALPALGPESGAHWSIRYRRSGAREWTHQGDYDTPDGGDVPLFEDQPEQLGRFDVRVTGPEGARFEQSVFVAEGLDVSYDDDLRLPVGDELTPVTAEVSSTCPSLGVFDPILDFDTETSSLPVRLRNGSASAVVVVRSPRLEFRMTPVGGVPAWSDRRIGRRPEDFAQATLAVRGVGDGYLVQAVIRDHGGKVYCTESFPRRSRSHVLTMPADRLAGAAREAQSGELVLLVRFPSYEVWEAPIVRFSTVGANVRVVLDGDDVTVRGLGVSSDIVLHVWKIARPWAPVLTVPLERGRGRLPASAAEAGDLRVTPVVEDAWDPVPPARFPGPDSVRFSRPGSFGDKATAGLSGFLSDQADTALVDPSRPEIWSALALLSQGIEQSDGDKFAYLTTIVRRDPRLSAVALAAADLATADKLALFIRTGLVFDSFQPDDDPESVAIDRRDLVSEPWLDLLLTISDIPAAPEFFRPRMRERLRDIGGYALPSILRNGYDPHAKSAALGRDLVLRSDEPDKVADFLSRKKLVPGGLIDPASRYDAYLALFQHKDNGDEDILRDFFEVIATGGAHPLNEVRRFRSLWKSVSVRSSQLGRLSQQFGWANAPFASFTLCLYARLAAGDHIRLSPPAHLTEIWSRFARRQPEQTMIDLVIADAMVTHLGIERGEPNPFSAFSAKSDIELVNSIVIS